MTKIQNTYKNANRLYWRAEEIVHRLSFYVVPISFLVFIFLAIAQLDYIQNRYKRDFSVLPIEKQKRYEYLKKEELKLYQEESALISRFNFVGAREVGKSRVPMIDETIAISSSAPHSSWSYHFYVAVGAIDPF